MLWGTFGWNILGPPQREKSLEICDVLINHLHPVIKKKMMSVLKEMLSSTVAISPSAGNKESVDGLQISAD